MLLLYGAKIPLYIPCYGIAHTFNRRNLETLHRLHTRASLRGSLPDIFPPFEIQVLYMNFQSLEGHKHSLESNPLLALYVTKKLQ